VKVHPACAIFPLLEGAEFDALVEDIRANGQREEILVDETKTILDGRNRYRACEALGIKPRTAVWRPRGDDSVLALIVSLNINRRHLTPSLKASLAEELEPMFAAEAAKRMAAGKTTEGAGGRGRKKNPSQKKGQGSGKAAATAAKATGANRAYVEFLKHLKKIAPEIHARVKKGELTIQQAKAALKAKKKAEVAEEIRKEPMPLPEGPFRVIVADPPWPYASRPDDPTHRARNPYPDMTLEDICAQPVAKRAADDAILWLWTTNAFLREAFAVLDAWGFEHKTMLTWVKKQMGTGDWLRGMTEHCLLAIKGRPLVTLTNQTTALIANRGKHSAKPEEFYALVEALCPGSKLEMFARTKRAGWEPWGAEAPNDEQR
jgi:N6-adenosine-specific RNA methylase IME4/ParB-like chromosome segregation protein Spo0J